MRRSPFLEDPRDVLARHIALAVDTPMEHLTAIHIDAAVYQAELARANGLCLATPRSGATPPGDARAPTGAGGGRRPPR